MATNPIATPRSSLDYGNFGPVSFGSTNSTTAAIGQNTYQPSQAPFAPVSPVTAPSMSIPRPTGTVAPVVVSANPAAERTISMVRNTNALSNAVNQQAQNNAMSGYSSSDPTIQAQIARMQAQAIANSSQAPQQQTQAQLPAQVAATSPTAAPQAPSGPNYWDPVLGSYVQGDINVDRPWERYGLGSANAFYNANPEGLRASAIERGLIRADGGLSASTQSASSAPIAGQTAGVGVLPYQGDLDRLQRETNDLQRKYMEDFEKMRNGTLPLSESQQYQLDAIKRQFDGLIEEQKTYNENYTQLVNRAGVSSGRNRYAPEVALGQMKKSVDDGLAKIRELNVKAIDTMFEVKLAMQQENWKNLDAYYTKLDGFMQRRQKAFQDMQDKLLEQAEKVKAANRQAEQDKINYSKEVAPGLADGLTYLKKDGSIYQPTEDEIAASAKKSGIDANILRSNVQKQISKIREDQKQKADKELESLNKDKRDLLDSAAKNSAPMSVINAINGAKTYAEAIQAGGDYLSNATGIIGEYNFYKRQEQAAGRVPVSFTEFQDQDANRKVLASTVANAQGLTPGQERALDSIATKHINDPLIKAGLEAERQKSLADQVLANPKDASEQIKALYLFVKGLDQNSAVREGEVALAQQTQSLLGKLGTKVEGVFTGKVISDSVARDLAGQVKSLADATIKVAEKQENKMRALAKGRGVGDAFEAYLKESEGLSDVGALLNKNRQTLDDFYVANPDRQGQIDALSADPRNFSDEEILQIIQDGFNPVGGDTKPATRDGQGSLSAKFESSGDPGAIGYDTTGGYSYGKYQLAHDNAKKFVDQSTYAQDFAGIAFNSPQFRAKWQEIAKRDPQGFAQAQQRYIEQTHLKPQEEKLAAAGFDLAKASSILKDVVFSTAVQHGPANEIILTALRRVGMGAPEEKLIRAIYDARWNGGKNFASSTKKVQKAVYNRFFGKNGELETALSRIA